MNNFFLIAIIVLIFLVIFQISKASEYVSLLKGEEKSKKQDNKLNGFLMISFLILGLIGVWWCNKLYYPLSTLDHGAASIEGKNIDTMIWMTIVITGIVFFITQILLFWFAFKYQHSDKRKALFYAHNNKLELIWTGIPAIVLTILVVYGLKYWFVFTSDAPKNAQVVEITGHQFGWEIRYPGKDGIFGKKNYKLTDPAKNNPLGVDWSDIASHDDIHVASLMYVEVNKPVKLIIHSQDVIHDVGLPAFRMKMDAVPGTPTTLWFTPIYTTTEMKVKTGNPDFVYEIACDQMCGKGHFTMRGVIEVVTPKEYKDYMIKLRPQYLKAKEFITQAPADSLKPIALDNHTH
ncbi:MAG: cytochrome c oxidase subunit II [Ginsengibacter sp.]|jgi:cytochrome c oxidase subunit 2